MAVSTVQVILNGQTYDLTYNSANGKYEKAITAPNATSWGLNASNCYGATVKATDDAGNITSVDENHSTLGASLKLRVKEITKPTISITSPSSGAKLTTSSPVITFQLRDSGSGVNLSTLALKIDAGAVIGSTSTGMVCTPVSGGYDCVYTTQTALGEGSHTITINVADYDDNVATQSSTTFTVDTVPPTLNISSPSNAIKINKTTVDIEGVTNDLTSSPVSVTIKVNSVDAGTVTVGSGGTFTKTVSLVAGVNTIVIRSTDSAGKYSEVTRTVTVDTTPPTISAITMTPNPVNVGNTFTISVTVVD